MFRKRQRQQLVIDVLSATLTKEIPRIRVNLDMIHSLIKQMEKTMTQETDAITELKTLITDLHEDVIARLDVAAGELSAEGKAQLDQVKDAIRSFDAEIGDANGSDTPPQPVDGGTSPLV